VPNPRSSTRSRFLNVSTISSVASAPIIAAPSARRCPARLLWARLTGRCPSSRHPLQTPGGRLLRRPVA
jgi:hypothetical protein